MLSPKYAFSARSASARSSFAATWLVRAVTYGAPTLEWARQGSAFALALALFLGAVDGWFRVRVSRSAQSFAAEADALVISSGVQNVRVAWSHVLGVEVWHRLNRVDYVAVHYRATAGASVATCWEQGARDELLQFVRQCAERVQAVGPRTTLALADLGDRTVRLALQRRLAVDLALALLVGIFCGIASHAIWLGAAAGVVSTLMVTAPHLGRKELAMKDGVWWERRRNGELSRLRVIPPSLKLWVSFLNQTAGSSELTALDTTASAGQER
jgi:hypothetical protein